MKITRESITKKLGFDPLHPPAQKVEEDVVDDFTPSLWAGLTPEEIAFVYKLRTGKEIPKVFMEHSE